MYDTYFRQLVAEIDILRARSTHILLIDGLVFLLLSCQNVILHFKRPNECWMCTGSNCFRFDAVINGDESNILCQFLSACNNCRVLLPARTGSEERFHMLWKLMKLVVFLFIHLKRRSISV